MIVYKIEETKEKEVQQFVSGFYIIHVVVSLHKLQEQQHSILFRYTYVSL